MRNSNRPFSSAIYYSLTLIAAALATPAHAGADEIALLNSMLERSLIAPEDYAAEMKLQGVLQSMALATAAPEIQRRKEPIPVSDTRLDYQWVTAMNEGTDDSPSAGHHDATSHHEAESHEMQTHEEHNHFEGAYAVLSEEWKRPYVRVDGEKIKTSEAAPSLGLGYTFALNKKLTLGLKLTGDFKSGEFGSGDVSGVEKKVLEKSHYSLAVEPGYVVDEHTLVFGILAYHHSKTAFEDGTQIKGISGVGYGVGFKRSLASHVFLMGEIQQVKYEQATIDSSTVKPISNTAALGLGYHF